MDAVERRLYLEAALKDRPDILDGMDDLSVQFRGTPAGNLFVEGYFNARRLGGPGGGGAAENPPPPAPAPGT